MIRDLGGNHLRLGQKLVGIEIKQGNQERKVGRKIMRGMEKIKKRGEWKKGASIFLRGIGEAQEKRPMIFYQNVVVPSLKDVNLRQINDILLLSRNSYHYVVDHSVIPH